MILSPQIGLSLFESITSSSGMKFWLSPSARPSDARSHTVGVSGCEVLIPLGFAAGAFIAMNVSHEKKSKPRWRFSIGVFVGSGPLSVWISAQGNPDVRIL